MATKYKTIVCVGPYQSGIYDGCYSRLEYNGQRFRTRIDGVLWRGNSGGFHEFVTYMDHAAGRKMLREFRQAHVRELKGEYNGPDRHDVLSGMC